MSDIGDSYGQITAEWFGDELSNFMFTFDNDPGGAFISRVNHISNVYNKTGEDLVSELIAFAANQKRTHMDIAFVDLYEQTVLVKKANQSANDSAFITSTPRNRVVLGERNISCIHDESIDSDIASDDLPSFVTMETDGPILGPKYISFTPVRCASSNAAYQSRKNSGKIVQNHIGNLFTVSESPEEIAEEKVEVEFADTESDLASLMRFGNEKDAEEIEEICSRIEMLSDAIRADNERISAFERCDHISSEPFFICGQIFDENEERLEPGRCCIRAADDDTTVTHLGLNELVEFSFFPGKVVALKGISENGSIFVPVEVFEPKKMQLSSIFRQPGIGRLHIWCAAGPFTSDDSFSYEQLCDLLDLAKQHQPHVLILMGPFVDRTSTAVLSPQLTLKFNDLFECLLMNISTKMENTNVQIILIPSSKKDAAALPIFPTAPLQVSVDCKKNLNENILFGADPSHVRIGGVQFALTNSEIMQVISREEIHCSPTAENEDRMARIAGHLLRQRSLYPLYPPPIDVAQRPAETIRRCALKAIPQVMILPSMLAPMIKVVDGCVCVNPGILVRGNSGTFMKMEIDLSMLGSKPNESLPNCSIADCCQVKVIRT